MREAYRDIEFPWRSSAVDLPQRDIILSYANRGERGDNENLFRRFRVPCRACERCSLYLAAHTRACRVHANQHHRTQYTYIHADADICIYVHMIPRCVCVCMYTGAIFSPDSSNISDVDISGLPISLYSSYCQEIVSNRNEFSVNNRGDSSMKSSLTRARLFQTLPFKLYRRILSAPTNIFKFSNQLSRKSMCECAFSDRILYAHLSFFAR